MPRPTKPREAKPAPAPYYRTTPTDVYTFIRECAKLPTRNDENRSHPIRYATACAFRKRLYYWRRSVLDTLAKVETKEAAECQAHIEAACGKRCNAEWLNLFGVRIEADGDTSIPLMRLLAAEPDTKVFVVGFLKEICAGPDIRFADRETQMDDAFLAEFKRKLRGGAP